MAHLLSKGILKARKPDLQACTSKKEIYEEIVKHRINAQVAKSSFWSFYNFTR